MQESPLEWVKAQGFEFEVEGSQLVFAECPICHAKDKKFYMNIKTGLWDCKHLNKHGTLQLKSSGNMFTLKKILGLTSEVIAATDPKFKPLGQEYWVMVDKSHERLMTTPHMLAILTTEWRITEDTVRKFKMGIKEDENHQWWLLIPHYVDQGKGPELFNIKYRSWFGDKKDFRRVKDAASVLFNESILYLPEKPSTVILCEGEKDMIVSDDAGVQGVIGMTGGAGTLLPRWYDLLEPIEDIVIAYDGDIAGSDGVRKLISRFGVHRCRVAKLPPGKDLADICSEQGPEALRKIIRDAKHPDIPSVASVGDVLFDDVTTEPVQTIPTFSHSTNKVLNGGVSGGQLVVLTAPPKIGKTTFSLKMAHHWSMLGMAGLFYCIEMPMNKIAPMVAGMHYGSGRNVGKLEKYLFRQDADLPLYLGFDSNVTTESLIQTFKDAHTRFGLQYIMFDNIHYMVRSISGDGGKVEAMENAFKALKMLTIELDIPIVCIAQPKKIDVKRGADMNYYDVAWTGSAASDADTILIVHRDRSEDSDRSFSDKMLVKADAGRFTQGGRTFIQYREKHLSFAELTPGELLLLGND